MLTINVNSVKMSKIKNVKACCQFYVRDKLRCCDFIIYKKKNLYIYTIITNNCLLTANKYLHDI